MRRLSEGTVRRSSSGLEQTPPHLVVVTPARDALDDHAEHDVVGVRVVPPLAGGKRRRGVEDVGDELLRLPDLVGVRGQVFGELLLELVAHQPARVVHEHPDGDVARVRQPREPTSRGRDTSRSYRRDRASSPRRVAARRPPRRSSRRSLAASSRSASSAVFFCVSDTPTERPREVPSANAKPAVAPGNLPAACSASSFS